MRYAIRFLRQYSYKKISQDQGKQPQGADVRRDRFTKTVSSMKHIIST